MSFLKYTALELADAKKSGFRKKRPKKPRASSSYTTLENYKNRYNNWVKELKEKAKEYHKRKKLLDEIRRI